MGGKHMKRLRAEKSKVKLKKKTLPKGLNVTQTAFTVKKIIAVEQLKKIDENEPVSNWNVPLKELLIRLTHYNFTSRLNSLNGIKELLKKNPEILKGPYLKSIIERLLELITDAEHKIRVTTINLLSHIFDLIPADSIKPFHGILIVHLGCAMTHRTASVQQDSLKFIDVLIKYSPEAIKCNFESITQNFIRILKNYLHESHSVFLPKGLIQDLEKTKTEILSKFHQFLVAGFSPDISSKEVLQPKCPNVLAQRITSVRSTNAQYKQTPNLSLLSKILEKKQKILNDNDSQEFQSLCMLVIPLLFDTWKEFSPNQVTSETFVSDSIGALLLVLLQILLLLYEKAVALKDTQMESWFISSYGPAFKKSFLPHFPYLATSNRSEAGHCSEFSSKKSSTFLSQNLIICYLSYSFKIVEKSSQMEKKIEDYILNVLLIKNQTEIELLLKVIQIVINASESKKSKIFLSNVVAAHNATNNQELQLGLSRALMDIFLKENMTSYYDDPSLKLWLKSLPNHLCKSKIFIQNVHILLNLIDKPVGNEMLKEMENKGKEIVMNLPNIKIEGASQLEGQKLIANTLYRCNNEVLKELLNYINFSKFDPPALKNYIIEIFSQKLKH